MKVLLKLLLILFLTWIPSQSFAIIDIIHFSKKDVSCPGANDGWLTVDSVTVSNPTSPPYVVRFTSNPGQTFAIGDTIFNLAQQTIIIRINDAGQIFPTNQSVDIDGPDPLLLDLAAIPATCFDTCNGQVFTQVQNGTPPYTYAWSNGSTSSFISNLCDGTYTVLVTDNNGCTISSFETVTEPNNIVPNVTPTNVLCNGDASGSATANVIDGVAPLTYAWSTGTTGASNTEGGLTQGSYDVTVTDANGCQSIEPFSITQPSALVTSSLGSDPTCSGGTDGFVNVTVNGGTIPYTFNWNDIGNGPQNRTGLSDGTYTVTVEDNNGCTSIESQTITEPTASVVTISGNDIDCFGDATGDITVSVTGGTAGSTTFDWSTTPGTQTTDGSDPYTSSISNLIAGKYYVTITNSSGCTKLDSLTLMENTELIPSFTTETNPSCNGGSDGSITASATGGVGPYTFNWPGNPNTNPLTNLGAGSYTVTVFDSEGCSKTLTSVLTQPNPIQPTLTPSDANCFGGNDGSISASAIDGTPPYTFNWPGNPNTNPLTGLTAGTYTVTVVDAGGCTITASTTVGQPTSGINISLTPSDAFCFGTATGGIINNVTGGTSPYTFAWNDGPTSQGRSNIATGTYTVLVTDNNGCTETESVFVSTVDEILVSMSADSVSCNGFNDGKAWVTYNSGGIPPVNTFAWSNGTNSDTIRNLTQGRYFVTVTDITGCTKVDSIDVEEPTQLVIDPPITVDPLCNNNTNGSITINVTGGTPGYTFRWNDNDLNQNRTGLGFGNYSVTVTDKNGCTNSIAATLNNPVLLTVSIDSAENVSCNGLSDGFARALASGGTGAYTYAWQGGPNSAANPNLAAGTYTVIVTDNNGCTATTSQTITEPNAIQANATVVQDAQCDGLDNGEVTANASGGTAPYTYFWDPGNINSQSLTGLSGGTYTVTVTDNNGCTNSQTLNVNQPSAITFTTDGTDLDCNGDNSGTASVINPQGGTSPYTYLWTPGGSTSQTAIGLSAQSYTVLVTDNNGCTNTGSVTISEPTVLSASITSSSNPTCNGINDGSASVTGTGGTIITDYSYLWSPDGETTASISNKSSGTYTVVITDDNGCTATDQVTLTAPTGVQISNPADTLANVLCVGGNNGYIGVSATGGVLPYTFDWDNIAGTNDGAINSNLTAGTYNLTVTDNNGCFETESYTITEPTIPFTVSITQVKQPCAGSSDGELTVTELNGTAPYTYNWTGTTQTTDTVRNLGPGFYLVNVTDANGCVANANFTLTPSTPIVGFTASAITNVDCFGDSTGSAGAIAFGGTGTLTFTWSNGDVTSSPSVITNLKAGTYTVTVNDGNSCTDTRTVTITEPLILDPNTTANNVSCSATADGSITSTPSGGTAPYSFVWSTGTNSLGVSSAIINLAPNTYTLTITDDNGCDSVETFIITKDIVNYTFRDSIVNESCDGVCDGYIEIKDLVGGVAPITYSWSDGTTGPINAGLCAGNYSVTISDGNSCDTVQSYTINPGITILANLTSNDASCGQANGFVTTTPSGGTPPYTFNWSPSTGTAVSTGNTGIASSLAPGNYDVTISDGTCSIVEPITIGSVAGFTFDTASINIIGCFGDCTGDISIANLAGGTSPYTFTWNGVPGSNILQNLCAGTYNLIISDNAGCDTNVVFNISQPDLLEPNITLTSAGCSAGSTGSATSTPIGGTAPFSFNWSNGTAQTGVLTGSLNDVPGSYTLTVTDASGCDSVETFTILKDAGSYTYRDSIVNESCDGVCDGYIEIKNLVGGVAPISYNWSNGVSGPINSNLCPGNYSLTISDANSCDSITSFTINPGILIAPNLTSSDASCGVANGFATVTPTGGVAPYTFNWSPSTGTAVSTGNTAISSSLAGGSYDVTINDATCTTVVPFIIGSVAGFTFDTTVNNVNNCFGDCNSSIAISNLVGGTTPYTFTWNGVQGINNIQNLCAGNYTLNIADQNGCDTTLSFTITQPTQVVPNLIVSNASCTGATNGTATSTPTGGAGPYDFNWSTGFNQTALLTSAITEPAGNYTLTVTDANGCDSIQSFTIGGAGQVYSYTDTISNMSCNGVCDGHIEIRNLTGGTAPITFNWSNGATGRINPNLCAGTYTLTISDANSCDSIRTFTITEPAALQITSSSVSDTCVNSVGRAEITQVSGGTTPYTFIWPGNISNTAIANNIIAGTYDVTIEDNSGCQTVESILVPNFSTFSINATVDSVSCKNGDDGAIAINTIGGVNPVTYSWAGGVTGGATPSGLTAGTYELTVTDFAGCSEIAMIDVEEPDSLTINISATNESCAPGNDAVATAFSLGGTPSYNYTWSSGVPSGNTTTGLTAGFYTATVTDKYGCEAIGFFDVFSDAPFTISSNTTKATCNGGTDGTIVLVVTGFVPPLTYSWDNGLPSDSTQNNLGAGTYRVTITDASTCSRQTAITVIEESPIAVSVVATDESCSPGNDAYALASVIGGVQPYTYDWLSGTPFNDSVAGLSEGAYNITVTDANGCSEIEAFTVFSGSDLDGGAVITDASCFGSCDGSIELFPTGGSGTGYTFAWDNGNTTNRRDNLCLGSYRVTITDDATPPCTRVENLFVTSPSQLTASTFVGTRTESCTPGNDGGIFFFPNGGTGPYSLQTSAGIVNNLAVTGLTAGNYLATVTDDNGCSITRPFEIIKASPPDISSTFTDATCNGGDDGTITISTSGGTNPYTYNWTGGLAGANPGTVSAGTYTVTVADGKNCEAIETVTVGEASKIQASFVFVGESCNPGSDGSATATVTGGTGPYNFDWGAGNTTDNFNLGLIAGSYTVTITDAIGCTEAIPYIINSDAPFNLDSIVNKITCNGANDGSIILSVTGNSGTISYAWDNGLSPGNSQGPLGGGVYTVTVTDAGTGCTETANFILRDPSVITINSAVTDESCSPGNDGTIALTPSGGTTANPGIYTYQWDNGLPATANQVGLAAGTYNVTVFDDNGCSAFESITVNPSAPFTVDLDSTDISCFGLTDGRIRTTTTANNPTYLWNNGLLPIADHNGLASGTYCVTITDDNGCTETGCIVINEPSDIIGIVTTTPESCVPGSDGSATVSATGGTVSSPSAYVFNWSTGASGNSITGLMSGSYDVTILDENGCDVVVPFTIGSVAPYTVDLDSTDVTCNGLSDGSITLTTTAINPTFAWDNGLLPNQNQSNLAAGTYNVTVTEPSSGCTETATITVNEPAILSATIATTPENCNPGNDGTASATGIGGTSPYTFNWSSGDLNVNSVAGLNAGNYDVTVFDANGCSEVEQFSIGSTAPFIVDLDSIDITCNGLINGSITVTTTAINPTFAWSGGLPANQNQTGLSAGTYTVTVTEPSSGCAETSTISVNEPTPINIIVNTLPESCSPGSDGSASALVSGGTSSSGNYIINWPNNQTGSSVSGLTAGNYAVTVTDDNGCTNVEPFNIGSVAPFFLDLDSVDVSCFGLSDGEITTTTSANFGFAFLWSGGLPSTRNQTNVSAGTYTVTVTEFATGCSETRSILVNEPTEIIPNITVTPESCNPGSDGTASATATGGEGNYTFDWSTGDLNTSSISSLIAGTYTLTVTDGTGCFVIQNFNVGSTAPFTVQLDSTDVSCNGINDGTITLTTTAVNPIFLWDNGLPANANQSNLRAGTYNVTVTEPSSGCSETKSISVNEPTVVSVSVNTTNESCSGNDGTATATGSGGTLSNGGAYSFAWSNGQSGTTVNNLSFGSYDVTITDDNGCTDVEAFSIGVDAPFDVILDSTNITCNGLADGTITLTTTAVNPTFAWDNGLPANANQTSLGAGIYNVTVTEPSSGCSETQSVSIVEPNPISITFVSIDDDCAPGNNGSATAIASGGTVDNDYSYLWSTGQTTASIGNLFPFRYRVTVTDDNGCTRSERVIIDSARTIVPNEVVFNESCNGACDGSIILNPSNGNGNYSYLWNTGETTRTRNGLCGGNYLVTITDGLNCDTVVSIDIISNFPLINSVATTDQGCSNLSVCDGGAVVTTSGGLAPYTYDWPMGTITGVTSDTAKSLCKGNYAVTITDASGCSSVEPFVIGGPDPITATFVTIDPSCNIANGQITVTATGGASASYTYQWFDAANNLLVASDTLKNVTAGIYFIEITDNTGCSVRLSTGLSDIGSEIVTVNETDASCFNTCDGAAIANFNCQDPNCTIDWIDAVTGTIISSGISNIDNLCNGDYFVRVTNNSGCVSINPFTIGSPDEFLITSSITDVSCNLGFDGSISITVTGGSGNYNYNWAPGPITGQSTSSVSGLTAGIYNVTVSDANLCDTVLSFSVGEPTEIMATFSPVAANCNQSNGQIIANVTGGSVLFDYDYQWFDAASNLLVGQSSPSINGLSAGNYFLRVRDDNSCEKIFITSVGSTNGPTIVIDSTRDLTCFDDNNGAIFTTASGADGPFTYNWLPQGQTNSDAINLSAGTYTIGVTNSVGCVTFDTVTISSPSELLANINISEASCGLCNGEARITASGGTAPYTYLWSNGSTVDSAMNLCGGSYSMVLSDASGCSKSFNFSVNTNGGPTGETVSVTNASCASNCDGSATVTPIGGTAPYTYLWLHNGATSNSLNNLCPGNYTLQVSDVKGCSRSVNIDILSPAAMSLNSTITAQTCNSIPCDGSIRVDISGGTSPYTYNWGPGSLPSSNSLTGLCAGIYNLTVTDANGCTLESDLTLNNSGVPLSVTPTVEDVTCFGSCDGSLISNITILTDYNYQWFNSQGSAISPINGDLTNSVCAGDYFLEITSIVSGCKSFENVTVGEPDSISLASSIVKNISCNGSCDGEIFISTIGGNILYQYSWDDPSGQDGVPAKDLCAGTYGVTATDANGCTETTSVTLVDPPVLNLSVDNFTNVGCSSDCEGTANVSGNGGTAPYTFDWSGGQTGASPTDLCFGQNIVTLTDATGCSIIDTINISAIDTVLAIVPNQKLYCGTDLINLKGESQGSSVNSVAWYIGDPATFFTSNLDTNISRPFGNYSFFLIASNGSCSDTTEFSFEVAPNPFVGLASSIAIFKDEIALFRLSNQNQSYSYAWSPGSFLNDSTIAEPLASPRESIVYTVTVLDTTGCTYQDSIQVIYTKDIEIPSGLSPNGDGVNDLWEIDFLEDFPNASVLIYNRWGELLYEQKNGYNASWDGTYEGKALPIGTYYYVIDLKSDRFEPLTGPITIVK